MSVEGAADGGLGSREAFGYLIAEQSRLARTGWKWLLAYMVIVTGPYWYLDVYLWDNSGLYALWNLITWALGYVLFVGLLQAGAYRAHDGYSGIGTYFVLGIVIGIPVAVGLVLLILPGVYLLMRWLPAYARARLHDEWVGNAMRWSWERTEPYSKPLFLALLPAVLAYISGLGLTYIYDVYWDTFSWTGMVLLWGLVNILISMGYALLTIYSVASYGLLIRVDHKAEGVPDDQS